MKAALQALGFLLIILLLMAAFTMVRADEPPALSDLERLRVENYALKTQLIDTIRKNRECQTALGPLEQAANEKTIRQEIDATKAFIEGNHPGFTFDPATGSLTATPKKGG